MQKQIEEDPLKIKRWFKKALSVPITTLVFFILILLPARWYYINWFKDIVINDLTPDDMPFIKALTFILALLIANIFYILLEKQIHLSRTVKDKENELYLSQKRFQRFIEKVPNVAVQGFELDGTIKYWNQASEEMYGYSRTEALENRIVDFLILPENRVEFNEMIDNAAKDGMAIGSAETSHLKKCGNRIPVYSTYAVVDIEEGKPEIFSMGIDLSDMKKMENELREAKVLAEVSNHAKNEFLASMSHELRTPLNSIIGFSDLLLLEHMGQLNEKQTRYADNISTSGKHLLGIINNILDISKAEAGKMDVQYETISIHKTINEIVDVMEMHATNRGIIIKTSIETNIKLIEVDSGKFKQIIYNLLGNAIKFSREGETVEIRVFENEGFTKFEIKDRGIGIKEEDIEKLFKPFTQINSFSTRQHEGTGLGLSLVKKLVELHKGHVWVKSEYEKYSIFGFAIPLKK